MYRPNRWGLSLRLLSTPCVGVVDRLDEGNIILVQFPAVFLNVVNVLLMFKAIHSTVAPIDSDPPFTKMSN